MGLTVVFPEAIKAQGHISVTVVAKADLTTPSAPKLADITDGVNASLTFYSGSAAPTSSTNAGEAPRRMGTTDVYQQFGTTTHSIGDLSYPHDPQADDTDPANAVRAVCQEGQQVYLIYRYGPDAETQLAVGDKVNVWLVELGPQNEGATGDGEFDELAITQVAIAKAPPVKRVAIVA